MAQVLQSISAPCPVNETPVQQCSGGVNTVSNRQFWRDSDWFTHSLKNVFYGFTRHILVLGIVRKPPILVNVTLILQYLSIVVNGFLAVLVAKNLDD